MTIYEVIVPALAMLGKSDSDADFTEYQAKALEVLKVWILSSKRMYALYASAHSLTAEEFTGYTVNDDFAYGETFAPAASGYIAMIMSPETERFVKVYDDAISELRSLCGSESGLTVNKYPI